MIARSRARRLFALGACFTAIVAVAGCKKADEGILVDAGETVDAPTGDAAAPVDAAPVVCNPNNPAPTYTQLYTKYFSVGKPGHCAKSGCHGDPDHTTWLCGTDKNTCYNGMVTVGLINKADPLKSTIADPKRSVLVWVNPDGGFMPQDATETPNNQGRDDIIAWVGACAQNN